MDIKLIAAIITAIAALVALFFNGHWNRLNLRTSLKIEKLDEIYSTYVSYFGIKKTIISKYLDRLEYNSSHSRQYIDYEIGALKKELEPLVLKLDQLQALYFSEWEGSAPWRYLKDKRYKLFSYYKLDNSLSNLDRAGLRIVQRRLFMEYIQTQQYFTHISKQKNKGLKEKIKETICKNKEVFIAFLITALALLIYCLLHLLA